MLNETFSVIFKHRENVEARKIYFDIFFSGAMYMEPCKRKNEAPLALSMPHFLNADPSYNERISGLNPDPEKHQFYMDVMPEFGFPLAIRARFQLNILLNGDRDIPAIRNVQKNLVMPFLWAGLGFDEPSELMAEKVLILYLLFFSARVSIDRASTNMFFLLHSPFIILSNF